MMTTGHRNAILKAIQSAGGTATMDELSDIGMTRKQLHDNVTAAVRDGLLSRIKDITGVPAYRLTDKGHARMLTNSMPAATQCSTSETSQPAVEQNTGSAALANSLRNTPSLAEGCVVIEAAKQGEPPAEPASDVNWPAVVARLEKICDEQAGELIRLRAENIALKTLNDALPGFGAAHEALKTTRYGWALDPNADLFDTPEEAATKAAEEESMSDTPNVVILACTPVGGVVVKPVFVPTLEAA